MSGGCSRWTFLGHSRCKNKLGASLSFQVFILTIFECHLVMHLSIYNWINIFIIKNIFCTCFLVLFVIIIKIGMKTSVGEEPHSPPTRLHKRRSSSNSVCATLTLIPFLNKKLLNWTNYKVKRICSISISSYD